MYYEPDTLWGRTDEGDLEIALPRRGLSIVQRRMLKQLGRPRTLAKLAARSQLDAPKVEHELVRLAQLQLVAFQRPGTTQPRTAPQIDLPLLGTPACPTAQPWQPPLPAYFGAVACGIGLALLILT